MVFLRPINLVTLMWRVVLGKYSNRFVVFLFGPTGQMVAPVYIDPVSLLVENVHYS